LGNGSNFVIMSRWLRGGCRKTEAANLPDFRETDERGEGENRKPREEREGDERKPLKFYRFSVDDLERGILASEGTSPITEEDMWEEGMIEG
jgi:hypothetical protein